MFFGAGNLIFPPFLGMISARAWKPAFWGFLFADAGLALITVISMTKVGGKMNDLFKRSGKKLSVVICTLIVLCLGPLLAIPRTSATTYEMAILPTIGKGFSSIIFSILFCPCIYFYS